MLLKAPPLAGRPLPGQEVLASLEPAFWASGGQSAPSW